MEPQLLLVSVVVVTILVALMGFAVGERRRRRATGQDGPRPVRSIGEALRASATRRVRVLVLFFEDDEPGLEAARTLAEDRDVLEMLGRGDLLHCVVRSTADEGRDVSAALFEKYAGCPMPRGPVALLLDPDGQTIGYAAGAEKGPLGSWLAEWVEQQPRQGTPAQKDPPGDDRSVATK